MQMQIAPYRNSVGGHLQPLPKSVLSFMTYGRSPDDEMTFRMLAALAFEIGLHCCLCLCQSAARATELDLGHGGYGGI